MSVGVSSFRLGLGPRGVYLMVHFSPFTTEIKYKQDFYLYL
jgi:hypothetical protein